MSKPLPSPITRMSQAMIVLGICAALIVAFVNLRDKPFIQLIEGRLLDWRFVLRGPIAVDPDIELVLIEKKSNGAAGEMPLAAEDLIKGLETISSGGARVVVLDPALVPMRALAADAKNGDAEITLANEIARLDIILLPYVFTLTRSEEARAALPGTIQQTAYSVFRKRDSGTVKRPAEAGGYLSPSGDLLRSALPGHVIEDHPRTFSRQFAYPVIGYGGSYYPSLAIQAYRRFVNLPMDAFEVSFGESLNIGSLYLPTDNQMRLAVNYHGPGGSYKRTRFGDLLEGELPADRFKDKLILVGLDSSIATDNVSTPFDRAMSKVEYLANVIDNINRMNPLIRSQQVVVLDILLLALIGLFFALVAAARSMWAVLTLAVIALALFVAADVQAFILFNLWLGLTFPLLAMVLCTAVLMMAKYVSKKRRAALKAQEEADETQFAAPWTFDRVAKAAADEKDPSLEEEEEIKDVEPMQKEERLILTSEEEDLHTEVTPEPEPSAEIEKKEEERPAENVTPFPSLKPPSEQAAGPSPLPVPSPATATKPAKPEEPVSTVASKNKPGKPASLIPVMDTSSSRGKVSLTSAPEMTRSPAAQGEFEVAVIFINMSGFLKLARSFGPTRSAQFLHAIYQLIEKTVVKHGGFMEQFAEDDVMALFGLPESSPEDASNGLRAARELAAVLSDWGEQQGFEANKTASFCICADYGPVKVHLNGTDEDVEVSLSGYTIGLASRLDRTVAAKDAGVVVSEKLMKKVSETDLTGQLKDGFTEQPMQQVPGSAEMIGLWRSEAGAL